jgi:hypothetical protein
MEQDQSKLRERSGSKRHERPRPGVTVAAEYRSEELAATNKKPGSKAGLRYSLNVFGRGISGEGLVSNTSVKWDTAGVILPLFKAYLQAARMRPTSPWSSGCRGCIAVIA